MKLSLFSWIRQVLLGILARRPKGCHYINGPETLPPPLTKEQEAQVFENIRQGVPGAREPLITHNLRLVVYIAKKFESPGASVEDLISIGTIGLIKAVNTFQVERNIKLATYASRCIENEILMHLRKSTQLRREISIDDPLNVDWDGNELLLSDLLGSDPDMVNRDIEQQAENAMLHKAVEKLSPRERKIVVLRFGLGSGREHTKSESFTDCAVTWKKPADSIKEPLPRESAGVPFVKGESSRGEMGTFSALAPMKTKQRAQQGLGPIQRTHIFLEHSHRLNAILNHKGTSGPLGKTSILIISYRNRLLHKIKHNTNFLSSAKQWMENLYFTEGHLPSRGTPAPLSVHLYSSTSLLDFQHLYVFFTKKSLKFVKFIFPILAGVFQGETHRFCSLKILELQIL